MVERLHQLLKKYFPGETPVSIHYLKKNAQVKINLGKKWYISPKNCLLDELRSLVGDKGIELKFD
jgi:DNA polymerase-3 subunit alpha